MVALKVEDDLRSTAAQYQGGAGAPAAATSSSSGPTVWWGTTGPGGQYLGSRFYESPRVDDLDVGGARGFQMLDDYTKDRQTILRTLIGLKLVPAGTSVMSSDVEGWWKAAMAGSAAAFQRGERLSPWDVLKRLSAGGAGAGGGGGGGGDGAFSGTRSTTSRSVQLTDAKTANALVDSLLQEQLGRDATAAEKAAFLGVLHSAEKANPTVTTTSTTYRDGSPTSQSSTTKGGLDAPGKQEVLEGQVSRGALRQERDAQRSAAYVGMIEQMVGRVGEGL